MKSWHAVPSLSFALWKRKSLFLLPTIRSTLLLGQFPSLLSLAYSECLFIDHPSHLHRQQRRCCRLPSSVLRLEGDDGFHGNSHYFKTVSLAPSSLWTCTLSKHSKGAVRRCNHQRARFLGKASIVSAAEQHPLDHTVHHSVDDAAAKHHHRVDFAKIMVSKYANRGKSWQRLGPIIEMASNVDIAVNSEQRQRLEQSVHHHLTPQQQQQQQQTMTQQSEDDDHHYHQQQQKHHHDGTSRIRVSNYDNTSVKSIVDVGCDHGLLSFGLAALGCFDRVLGVDVSESALARGASSLYRELHKRRAADFADEDTSSIRSKPQSPTSTNDLDSSDASLSKLATEVTSRHTLSLLSNLEFRVGDGLQGLKLGEADAVCMAGIGYQTMIQILTSRSSEANPSPIFIPPILKPIPEKMLHLDRLACQALLLQPANSKPTYLIKLYDTLQQMGWRVHQEHMTEISSPSSQRWFMTTMFLRGDHGQENNPMMTKTAVDGVVHHPNNQHDENINKELPGCRLVQVLLNASSSSHSSIMKEHYHNYVVHHTQWLRDDLAKKGILDDDAMRWLQFTQQGSVRGRTNE